MKVQQNYIIHLIFPQEISEERNNLLHSNIHGNSANLDTDFDLRLIHHPYHNEFPYKEFLLPILILMS